MWRLGIQCKDHLNWRTMLKEMKIHEKWQLLIWKSHGCLHQIICSLMSKGYPRNTHFLARGSNFEQWWTKMQNINIQTSSNEHMKTWWKIEFHKDFYCLKKDLEVWLLDGLLFNTTTPDISGKLAWKGKALTAFSICWCLCSRTSFCCGVSTQVFWWITL